MTSTSQAMNRYELCRPTDDVASEFQEHVTPILRRIVGNIHESRALTALRDTLLPKLISGEVRTRSAESCATGSSRSARELKSERGPPSQDSVE